MDDSPAARMRVFREHIGLDQAQMAERLDVSQASISHAENGRRAVSAKLIDKLFKRFGLNQTWLLYGKGAMYVDDPDQPAGNPYSQQQTQSHQTVSEAQTTWRSEPEFQTIPRFDVQAAAGSGRLVLSEQVIDHVAFTRSWLIRQGIDAGSAGLVEVRGDSMAPHIRDGSLALVHFKETQIDSGQVYAFTLGDDLFIKRLVTIERGFLIQSDNPSNPPHKLLDDEANGLIVRGRVRAVITKF